MWTLSRTSTSRAITGRPATSRGQRLLLVLGVILGLLPVGIAQAAGPAVLSVDVTILDAAGAPATTINPGVSDTYQVNIAYSCSTANCDNTVVTIDPTPLDPYYGHHRKESSYSFVPPYTPAPPISGSLATGLTVDLGTVTAGVSGSFRIVYDVASPTSGYTAGASYFPDGASITPTVAITSDTATGPVADSAHATLDNDVPDPHVNIVAPTRTRTGESIDVSTFLSHSGCVERAYGLWWAQAEFVCAASYDVTIELPANAVYVGGGGGTGVYDAGNHEVTYQDAGNDQEIASGLRPGMWPITVSFDEAAYPTSEPGCIADEEFVVDYTITYLDGTTKTASETATVEVQNCEAFALASMGKVVRGDGTGTVTELPIPVAPGDTQAFNWQAYVENKSNVAGVATIVDDALDIPDMPVTEIQVLDGHPSTVDYTLDDGTTGSYTAIDTSLWAAPAGRHVVAVTATSSPLPGPRARPSDSGATPFRVRFYGEVAHGATPATHTNTATGTMSYPDHPALGVTDLGPIDRSVDLIVDTDVVANAYNIWAELGSPPTTPVVGSPITWRSRVRYDNVSPGATLRPQQVFLAPPGWEIDSASFDAGAPAGVTIRYADVVHEGVSHRAVIAEWPGPIGDAGNVYLPRLNVQATPTLAAPAGSNDQQAWVFVGDANDDPLQGFVPTQYVDVDDVDDDGVVTDEFARRGATTSLAPTLAVGVTKEICRPDAGQPDGCDWIADPGTTVGVAPTATSITYRVTIENQGNDALTGVVAYDVLPHVGDTGTIDATAGSPRGSTVQETLSAVTAADAGVTLDYSTSTNPPRPEVWSGTTAGDWTAPESGAAAIRATIPTLPAFESRTFTYEAALVGASANQTACNSVALAATSLTAIEPPAVCATTQEADFSITTADRFALQVDRPGVIPFVVNQGGGSPAAYGEVTIDVPTGMVIGDLTTIGDWACTASASSGPATVTCVPEDGTVAPRELDLDVPETIELPVIPDVSTVGAPACFDGHVVGALHDPELANNDTVSCSTVAPAGSGVSLTKDDGTDLVQVGDEITYTLEVANLLLGESISGATLVDTLPTGVSLVSATGGPTVVGQVLTWDLADLAPAGTASGTGGSTSGAPGSTQTFTVTVEVGPGAVGTITNDATVTAPDPQGGAPFEASDDDVDTVQDAGISLGKDADVAEVVAVGDTVTYDFEITNTGNVELTNVVIHDPMPNLSAITCDSGPMPLTLAAGAVEDCQATYSAASSDFVAESIVNEATVSGQPPLGPPVSGSATATVVATPAPGLTLTKEVTEASYRTAGDVLNFTLTVVNDGNVDVTDLVIDDHLAGTSPVVCDSTSVAAGASTTCAATYAVTAGDLDAGVVINTATATAGSAVGPVTSLPATASVDAIVTPGISLVKTVAEDSFADAGAVLRYDFVVTNTGNVTLSGIEVGDPLPGLSAIDCPSTVLPAGAAMTCTATYTTTQADVDSGEVASSATASGDPAIGQRIASAPSAVSVPSIPAPAVSLVKSVDVTELTVGQVATYTFEVQNTGNVTLDAITVDDPLVGLSAIACDTTTLAPNEVATCTATYEITQTDIDELVQLVNTATASGVPPTGTAVDSNAATAAIPPVVMPSLMVEKTASEDSYDAVGDVLHYGFTVTNTGNVTLHDVVVADPLPGLSEVACESTTLAPGASATCAATYVVQQADLDDGSVVNNATASGVLADGSTATSEPSSVEVDAIQNPDLQLTKSVVESDFTVGETLHFRFDVVNTGNVTVNELAIDDAMEGLSAVECPTSWLSPGDATQCEATYVATAADVAAGRITNAASASGGFGVLAVASTIAAVELPAAPQPELARTGSEAARLLKVALLALVAGGVLVAVTRRRRPVAS